jgi:malto-oligosyltrehalose trehalohydrolase
MINGLLVPDPASRFQPDDVHGPSELIDPHGFKWRSEWSNRPWEDAVIYELHIGSFTPEGTFLAAIEKLPWLASIGITAIELMPVADFPGAWGWGYDGVLLYAPDASYGRPEHLKRLIQAAHDHGIMAFLDVVYNHFGPGGNYLPLYAPIFNEAHKTPWGAAVNFDAGGPRLFESSSFRTRFIGSRSFVSTGCGWTLCMRSRTVEAAISWKSLRGGSMRPNVMFI